MSHYRRANTPNATYFFTVVTYRRQAFLCDEPVRNALRKAIHNVQTQYPFKIDASVLLHDHMHSIWTMPENDANFSLRWQLIKRYVTRECGAALNRLEWLNASKTKHQEATLWQRRFWEHQIHDDSDYQTHMDYCHFNPVKHCLVKRVQDGRILLFTNRLIWVIIQSIGLGKGWLRKVSLGMIQMLVRNKMAIRVGHKGPTLQYRLKLIL